MAQAPHLDFDSFVQRKRGDRAGGGPETTGHDYTYEVTAKWKEDGHEVTQSRRVRVHAGERVSIIFPQAAPNMAK